MQHDGSHHYGRTSIINHWLLALLIIGMLALGLYMQELPRGEARNQVQDLHKSIGVLVLLLGLWRVGWRVWQRFPSRGEGFAAWERKLARGVQWLLLTGIVLMPLTGYLVAATGSRPFQFFGLVQMPFYAHNPELHELGEIAHKALSRLLIALLALHLLGVFKHWWQNRAYSPLRLGGDGKA